jgi:hypothetical protein
MRALLASLDHFELISLPLGGCFFKQIDEPILSGLLLVGSVLLELVAEVIVEGVVGCVSTVGVARGLECIQAVTKGSLDVCHWVQVVHRNDLGRVLLVEVSELAWDDLQVVLHLVDPLFPEGVVVLEAGHLVRRAEFLEGLESSLRQSTTWAARVLWYGGD